MSEGQFEAKVTRLTVNKGGVFLTLSVHPNDYGADLATLPVGSKLMVGWAEIVNTEVEKIEVGPLAAGQEEKNCTSVASQTAPGRVQDNWGKLEPDGTLPTSSQAEGAARERPVNPKERRKWEDMPYSQQAAIRCGEKEFQEWIGSRDEGDAAEWVRSSLGIATRSILDNLSQKAAREEWEHLESQYQSYLLDLRYGNRR